MDKDRNLKESFSDMEDNTSLLRSIVDGDPVNKNPLVNIPNPEMVLYYIDNNYFESIEELLVYCRTNNQSTKGLGILEYYRNIAGRSDVIRKSNNKVSILYSACDEDGYGMYNNERSIYRGKFTWEYNYGSINHLYKPFRDKGIIFENDIYAKISARNKQLIKMCREQNLFGYGKSNN